MILVSENGRFHMIEEAWIWCVTIVCICFLRVHTLHIMFRVIALCSPENMKGRSVDDILVVAYIVVTAKC